MRYMFYFFSLFIFFSCSKFDIAENSVNNSNGKGKTEKEKIINEEKIESVSSDKLAVLFFEKRLEQNKIVIKEIKKEKVLEFKKSVDYNIKFIADWTIDNTRYVKFKDINNNLEYVINENDKTGKIVILERTLFSYKIKIDDNVVEVKR